MGPNPLESLDVLEWDHSTLRQSQGRFAQPYDDYTLHDQAPEMIRDVFPKIRGPLITRG